MKRTLLAVIAVSVFSGCPAPRQSPVDPFSGGPTTVPPPPTGSFPAAGNPYYQGPPVVSQGTPLQPIPQGPPAGGFAPGGAMPGSGAGAGAGPAPSYPTPVPSYSPPAGNNFSPSSNGGSGGVAPYPSGGTPSPYPNNGGGNNGSASPYPSGNGGSVPTYPSSGGGASTGRSTSFGNGNNSAPPSGGNLFSPPGGFDYHGTSNGPAAGSRWTSVESRAEAASANTVRSVPGDVITIPVSSGSGAWPASAPRANADEPASAATSGDRQAVLLTLQPRPKDAPVGSYGHDPQYGWLRGTLEYSQIDRQWRLRYIRPDAETDQFGGYVVLPDSSLLSGCERGDFLEVRGKLGIQDARPGRAPTYQATEVHKLPRAV